MSDFGFVPFFRVFQTEEQRQLATDEAKKIVDDCVTNMVYYLMDMNENLQKSENFVAINTIKEKVQNGQLLCERMNSLVKRDMGVNPKVGYIFYAKEPIPQAKILFDQESQTTQTYYPVKAHWKSKLNILDYLFPESRNVEERVYGECVTVTPNKSSE
jgi:N-acetyl-beta-hexosaminidase